MTKPPTSVRSIRLADELWARLQAEADNAGVSLNRYVAGLVEGAGRRGVTAKAAAEPASARPAVRVAVPLAGTFERRPYQKFNR